MFLSFGPRFVRATFWALVGLVTLAGLPAALLVGAEHLALTRARVEQGWVPASTSLAVGAKVVERLSRSTVPLTG